MAEAMLPTNEFVLKYEELSERTDEVVLKYEELSEWTDAPEDEVMPLRLLLMCVIMVAFECRDMTDDGGAYLEALSDWAEEGIWLQLSLMCVIMVMFDCLDCLDMTDDDIDAIVRLVLLIWRCLPPPPDDAPRPPCP